MLLLKLEQCPSTVSGHVSNAQQLFWIDSFLLRFLVLLLPSFGLPHSSPGHANRVVTYVMVETAI